MTVIATDGKSMAGDSFTCDAHDLIVARDSRKVVRGKDGSLLGCAGEAWSCELVREWFKAGASLKQIPKVPSAPNKDGESRFKAIILRPNGRVETLDACFMPVRVTPPYAIGSGGDVALGAMKAGASPKRAVEIACDTVTSCGGPVRSLKPKRKS